MERCIEPRSLYYGGHVAYARQRGTVVYHLTIHGYANEARLQPMMAALIRRETGPIIPSTRR